MCGVYFNKFLIIYFAHFTNVYSFFSKKEKLKSNPIQTDINWIGFDSKIKSIGWSKSKTDVIGSNGFLPQNWSNPICEQPYVEYKFKFVGI